jgi:hypothetical protein
MVASINASTSAGVVTTADTSGILALQTAGTTAVTLDASQNATFAGSVKTNTLTSAASTALTLQSAGTTAVTIDTSQNVLVGTTTTTNNLRNGEKVAVVTTGSGTQGGASLTTYSGTGAGSGVILDIQRSRGTTDGSMTAVASGDTLGYLLFRGSDGTSFQDSSYITGQVDGAVSAGTVPGRLAFITSGSERMRIDSSGNLLVGTTSGFGGIINAVSTGNPLYIKCTTSNQSVGVFWNSQNSTGTSANLLNFGVGSSYTSVGTVTYNGTNTLYNSTSDQRLKKNIVDSGSGLAKLSGVKIRAFDWIEHENHTDFGVVAQELITVAPEAVSVGDDKEAIERIWAVDTSTLVPAMIKAIQELKAINDTQTETINALTARIVALEGA